MESDVLISLFKDQFYIDSDINIFGKSLQCFQDICNDILETL